jgi:hypothetical protein
MLAFSDQIAKALASAFSGAGNRPLIPDLLMEDSYARDP